MESEDPESEEGTGRGEGYTEMERETQSRYL